MRKSQINSAFSDWCSMYVFQTAINHIKFIAFLYSGEWNAFLRTKHFVDKQLNHF